MHLCNDWSIKGTLRNIQVLWDIILVIFNAYLAFNAFFLLKTVTRCMHDGLNGKQLRYFNSASHLCHHLPKQENVCSGLKQLSENLEFYELSNYSSY